MNKGLICIWKLRGRWWIYSASRQLEPARSAKQFGDRNASPHQRLIALWCYGQSALSCLTSTQSTRLRLDTLVYNPSQSMEVGVFSTPTVCIYSIQPALFAPAINFRRTVWTYKAFNLRLVQHSMGRYWDYSRHNATIVHSAKQSRFCKDNNENKFTVVRFEYRVWLLPRYISMRQDRGF